MSLENAKNPAAIAEITSGFDYDEDITIAAADIDLDTATAITDFTGVAVRNEYYCRGITNPNESTAMTVKYQLFSQVGSGYRTMTLQPGQQFIAHVNIALIAGTGNGSTAGDIKLHWKKREFFNVMLHDKL